VLYDNNLCRWINSQLNEKVKKCRLRNYKTIPFIPVGEKAGVNKYFLRVPGWVSRELFCSASLLTQRNQRLTPMIAGKATDTYHASQLHECNFNLSFFVYLFRHLFLSFIDLSYYIILETYSKQYHILQVQKCLG
jgi:hypothetical protein